MRDAARVLQPHRALCTRIVGQLSQRGGATASLFKHTSASGPKMADERPACGMQTIRVKRDVSFGVGASPGTGIAKGTYAWREV